MNDQRCANPDFSKTRIVPEAGHAKSFRREAAPAWGRVPDRLLILTANLCHLRASFGRIPRLVI
jgi:hypothetical protein